MKKSVAVVALAGILTLSAGTMAAQAAPGDYGAPAPAATVSSGTVAPGSPVVFSGSGFLPGESINITVTSVAPTAAGVAGGAGAGTTAKGVIRFTAPVSLTTVAAADGSFSIPVTLTEAGTYALTATGVTSGTTVSQTVKVAVAVVASGSMAADNAAAVAGTGLAATGVDSGVLAWSLVGAGALAAGAGTVVVSRRRVRGSAE